MIFGVDSRTAFTVLIGLVAVQRLWELEVAKRNTRRLRSIGAREEGAGHYSWMVALHSLFLPSCLAEVWLLDRPWRPLVGLVSMFVLIAAVGLRWWTLSTLGERWTTRILVMPEEELVTSGPYRWVSPPQLSGGGPRDRSHPHDSLRLVDGGGFQPEQPGAPGGSRHSRRARPRSIRRGGRLDRRRSVVIPNDEKILKGIVEVAHAHLGWCGELRPEMHLVEDLELDSLKALTLALEVENRFKVYLDQDGDLVTVGDLVAAIRRQLDG